MPENLFEGFKESTLNEWLDQARKELNGADPASLNAELFPGFCFPPYLTSESRNATQPSVSGGIREWIAALELYSPELENTMEMIAGEAGRETSAACLFFTGNNTAAGNYKAAYGIEYRDQESLFRLFDAINPLNRRFCFFGGADDFYPEKLLVAYAADRKLDPAGLSGFSQEKIFSIRQPNPGKETDGAFANAATRFREAKQALPEFCPLMLPASIPEVVAAGPTMQLAALLCMAAEYLRRWEKEDISPADFFANAAVSFEAGNTFFVEVAKIRAFRKLWMSFQKTFGANPVAAIVHSRPSLRLYSSTDPQSNILRATTAAISLVMGGADIISLPPHDVLNSPQNHHSSRIAINIQHLLRHESLLGTVDDSASGSYYVEELTQQIADQALKIFQDAENAGGWISAMWNKKEGPMK